MVHFKINSKSLKQQYSLEDDDTTLFVVKQEGDIGWQVEKP
jgi:hypothetical protein